MLAQPKLVLASLALALPVSSLPVQGASQVPVCKQGGQGFLSAAQSLDLPRAALCVEIGDLNSDGVLDIVAGCVQGRIAIQLGLGEGVFAASAELIAASDPNMSVTSIHLEDLNADGTLDVIAMGGLQGTGELAVLFGVGDGTMASVAHYALYSNPRELAVADWNGDGETDLAVASGGVDRVQILLGNGAGAFSLLPEITVERPSKLAVGDLDDDGFEDLIVSWNPTSPLGLSLSLYHGLGDGTFGPPLLLAQGATGSIRAAANPLITDINLDGVNDLVATGGGDGVGVRLGLGGGSLSGISYYGGPAQMSSLVDLDLNTDGLRDLLFLSGTDIGVLLAITPGQFGLTSTFHSTGSEFGFGDLDTDGAIDVVQAGGDLSLLFGVPRAAFEDGLSPNHSCDSAFHLGVGQHTSLVTFRATAEDHFKLVVPHGSTLAVDVLFEDARGDIDCYLYDAVTVGNSCGDKSDYLVRGFSATDNESITWINTTGATQTYYLQVALWNNANNTDCNTYELSIAITTPSFGSSICAGDGSLIACPCDNESSDPAEGCQNSKNVGAKIAATGTPRISSHDAVFHLTQGIPGDPALLIEGRSMIASPFRDGILCMGGFTTRLQAVMMDGDGNAATSGSIAGATNLVPGQTRYYQWWYRDPGGVSPCGTGSNFSGGLAVTWL